MTTGAPEIIPDSCKECTHFARTGRIDKFKGHCGFYDRFTLSHFPCYATRIGEPTGAAPPKEIPTVFFHPDGRRETVKDGFSWPALFFGAVWAWVKGMVGLGFALLGLGFLVAWVMPILFALLLGEAGIFVDLLFNLVVVIWLGAHGNEWRRSFLLRKGFTPERQAEKTPTQAIVETPKFSAVRECPNCSHPYKLSDYRPDAEVMLCTNCREGLPR